MNLPTSARLPAALCGLALAFAGGPAAAQNPVPPTERTPTTWPANGVRDERAGAHAFEHATIVVAPGRTLEDATLLIRDGRVVAVGRKVDLPPDAVRHDATGQTLVPAFIEPWGQFGVADAAPRQRDSRQEQLVSERPGAWAWNEALHPEFRADRAFAPANATAEPWRKAGYGAVLSHRQDGIARGSGALVLTLGDGRAHDALLDGRCGAFFSFRKGSSTQPYPSSLMGAIALLRQTHLDAAWYAAQPDPKPEANLTLEAWNELMAAAGDRLFFEVDGPVDALRAHRLGEEFGLSYTFRGDGTEYRRAAELAATGAAVIVPLDFPEPYDVRDPLTAELIDYTDLLHWAWAPHNPAALREAGIRLAFTTQGLDDVTAIRERVRVAMAHGLSAEDALAALTTVPADLAGAADRLGTLEPGKVANFLRCSGPVFAEGTEILETWVAGEAYRHAWPEAPDRDGVYRLTGEGLDAALALTVRGDDWTLARGDAELDLHRELDRDRVALSFTAGGRRWRLAGWWSGQRLEGRGEDDAGARFDWKAVRTGAAEAEEAAEETAEEAPERPERPVPFQAFGRTAIPPVENVVFRGATVWTNGPDGILEDADVWVRGGRVEAVGRDLKAKGAREVDASGMHLTSGIIDEHSHIAIRRGVNEGTQASSAEVRIGDVVDGEDIDLYRQLAGGVTAAQLLHGSANPIGGQSALIKLRWGGLPEELKIEGADGFIKFALGENVKQTNWGDDHTSRFPQTRMGVEQVFVDHFTRAVEYGRRKAAGDPTLRPDLDLEALLEVVRGERFITCHSYVQSEINMLMAVAERFGFRVNTFTHILEGYKVADRMAGHGAGGSTFADWWAYKYEVNDAIPHNAALLERMGVVTAINSDDAEMGRRLNQQAAKAVKYGGMSEEEAWKTVTLNPARLLHLDGRMGSLEPGKDADLVLWTDHPLSIYAIADQTWVDGRRLYSREEDRAAREALRASRQALIARMLDEADGGAPTRSPEAEMEHHYHCDDQHDEGY